LPHFADDVEVEFPYLSGNDLQDGDSLQVTHSGSMRVMMSRSLRLENISTSKLRRHRKQTGYILLTLMLAVALFTVAMVVALPQIGQQLRRDKEEELCHRGTAYMRAIQTFHRKLGRYPTRIEELENSNDMRFIRKLYKDPMTRDRATGREKDFKILREMDISSNNGSVVGQTGQSTPPAQDVQKGQGGPGNVDGTPGGLQKTDGPQSPPSGSDAGGDLNSPGSSPVDTNSDSGSDEQTLGGGPILGVVSTSKEESIREFFGKNHYDDWLFIYLQNNDFSGQLKGPANPGVPTAGSGGLGGVAPGLPGQGQGTGQTSNPLPQSAPNSVAPSPN
jgi:type II secretory pathway pseudopilin PulG